jgi:DNA-binding response OmpR family regulator
MTSGSRILLVDDDPALRMIVSEELAAEGFIVDEADRTEQALEHLNQRQYDLAVVDLNLSGESGLDILKFISHSGGTCKAITMTGACKRDAVESMAFGAADFVSKPFEMDELISMVKAVLHQDQVVLS